VRSDLKTAHTSGTTVYTPGELYGGSDSSALCFTCEASDVTGTAPPSESLDSGSGVNTLTGDYSYSLNLFNAPGIGVPMSDALTYDAQLAQAQIAARQYPGPLGYGWSSTLSLSVTPGLSSNEVVNEGSDAQDTFSESASSGTSTSCPTGDYPTTNKYTISSSSSHQWCALANVQGQFADFFNEFLYFNQQGGQESYGYSWNGDLANDDSDGTFWGGFYEIYNVAPGSSLVSGPNPLTCLPAAFYCDLIVGEDGRQILEAFNSSSQIIEIVGPNGITYNLGYDSHGNLVTVSSDIIGSGTSTWSFVYDTSAPSPDTSDLVQIYDPDSGVGSSPPVSAGSTHSNYIAYNNSGPDVGMVGEVEDGTGAVTIYSYADGCSTGNCVLAGNPQSTTVTYPAQVRCPSCTAVSSVENDQYTSGVETETTLGALGGGANSETWQYAWSMGYGAADSTETITYPDSLSGSSPTATIILDPAGNVISTTNALGDVATSAYNDVGANVLPELLWSYPGSSSNGPSSPPSGSEVYTYNPEGYVQTETDPLGNITKFGYYYIGEVLCYVEPPSVASGTGLPGTCEYTGGALDNPGSVPPVGSTVFQYDEDGDLTSTSIDYDDTATGADPQTTTSSFDLMGDSLWSIPPAGQSGAQSSSNPYATVSTYLPNGLVASVAKPSEGTTNYTYDLALNPVTVETPYSGVYQMAVFDGDNRPCFELTNTLRTGLTCSTGAQAGSTTTTYMPGSTNVHTSTDSLGKVTTSYYGDLAYPNSPTEVVDAANDAVQYTAYNDYGSVCESGSVSIAIGTSTQCNAVTGDTKSVYNSLGNETSVTDPSGNATTNAYIDSSYPTLETSSTNALSEVTNYSYDADGELTTTTNPDGTTVQTSYDADGRICTSSDNGTAYGCGSGTGVSGVTTYTYNGASDRLAMTTYSPSAATTTYSYANGELLSTTDANSMTLSYLYNYDGQVICEAYPVDATTGCGTISSPASGSPTNTIVKRVYDSGGRLQTVTDWMSTNNTTTYTYGDVWTPDTPTSVASAGATAAYSYNNNGEPTSLSAGSAISDNWTYDNDQREASVDINGSTSASTGYNHNDQVTSATNLGSSTSNDTYTVAANGEITKDVPPTGTTTSFAYNAGDELCWSANVSSTNSCSSPPSASVKTTYTYSANGERASAATTTGSGTTTTDYAWNPYGELCNVSTTATACGSIPANGTSYIYNGDGLRTTSTTTSTATDSTWDPVAGGSIPLNINDAKTSGSSTTNVSYIYGDLLFGGTAPIEQISTTTSGSTAVFLVASQTGVQGVFSSSGATNELAVYSPYGEQTIKSGSDVTPFGFQGSYTDPMGLIYLVNRYYDPTTDQFLSIDPDVATTDQPYVFTNDNPLNEEDPLGLCFLFCWRTVAHGFDVARHGIAANSGLIGIGFGLIALTLATGGGDLIVAGGLFTASDVAGMTFVSGAVGTYLDGASCNDGSYIGCSGFGLGLASGGSAVVDFLGGVADETSLLVGSNGMSTAGRVSTVSGGVALLLDIANYVKSSANATNKTPARKLKK
jgi:RHS repeat-associated protein